MKDNWIISKRKYDDIILQLLKNRGVAEDEVDNFLQPNFQQSLHDVSLLPDYQRFVDRIKEAVKGKQKIGIFADYDADGIPGAVLLHKAVTKLGLITEVYIPARSEGYGLSIPGIEKLKRAGCSIIITVDLGIKSIREAEYCREHNIDLIITDHHLPGEQLPQAVAVINPKIAGSKYKFRELCGCGLIFKLISGLQSEYPNLIDEKFIKWNLDLAAISTISDVVPLIDENRLIARYGLVVVNKTKNPGLKKLIEVAGLSEKKIGAYEVGFVLGPRINAPGRMKDAMKAFNLLATSDEAEADRLAKELNDENELRQTEMKKLIESADLEISNKHLDKNKIIILCGPWSRGVIGPSASQIAEKYCRPTIIFSNLKEEYVGSARSFREIDIFSLILDCSGHLSKFGGHKGAAGLSVEAGKYEKFKQAITNTAAETISDSDLDARYQIDAEVNFSELSFNLLEKIQQLEPFGYGNPRPLFVSRGVVINWPKNVGKSNNHLSMMLEHENKRIKSIYFSHPFTNGEVRHGTNADIVYNVNIDQWNGSRYLNICVTDMDLYEKR